MTKVLISLPKDLVRDIDQAAKFQHKNRSQAAREAFEAWLQQGPAVAPKDLPGAAEAMRVMDEAAKQWAGPKGGIVKALRKSRDRL